jgi:hypothetical protein
MLEMAAARTGEVGMKLWMKGTALLAAFLLGVALTGVASSHSGFGAFLHAGHSDTMDGTLTAKGFKFKPKETGRLVVPAAAFQVDAGDLNHTSNGQGTATLSASGNAIAPVSLPDRAVITRLSWFHDIDLDAGSAMRLQLRNADGSTANVALADFQAGEDCADLPCATTDDFPGNATVNNRRRHYWLEWVAQDEQETHKVVIVYKVATPGTD